MRHAISIPREAPERLSSYIMMGRYRNQKHTRNGYYYSMMAAGFHPVFFMSMENIGNARIIGKDGYSNENV